MGMKRDKKESSGQDGTNNSTDAQKGLKSDDGGSSDCLEQLTNCKEIGLKFEVTGALPKSNFCSFIEENSEEDVVGFFREIAREVEEKRGVMDFHLRVREQKQWFCVEVLFGDAEKKGPEETMGSGECISCFPGAALFPGRDPGVTAGECVGRPLVFVSRRSLYRISTLAPPSFVSSPFLGLPSILGVRSSPLIFLGVSHLASYLFLAHSHSP